MIVRFCWCYKCFLSKYKKQFLFNQNYLCKRNVYKVCWIYYSTSSSWMNKGRDYRRKMFFLILLFTLINMTLANDMKNGKNIWISCSLIPVIDHTNHNIKKNIAGKCEATSRFKTTQCLSTFTWAGRDYQSCTDVDNKKQFWCLSPNVFGIQQSYSCSQNFNGCSKFWSQH